MFLINHVRLYLFFFLNPFFRLTFLDVLEGLHLYRSVFPNFFRIMFHLNASKTLILSSVNRSSQLLDYYYTQLNKEKGDKKSSISIIISNGTILIINHYKFCRILKNKISNFYHSFIDQKLLFLQLQLFSQNFKSN